MADNGVLDVLEQGTQATQAARDLTPADANRLQSDPWLLYFSDLATVVRDLIIPNGPGVIRGTSAETEKRLTDRYITEDFSYIKAAIETLPEQLNGAPFNRVDFLTRVKICRGTILRSAEGVASHDLHWKRKLVKDLGVKYPGSDARIREDLVGKFEDKLTGSTASYQRVWRENNKQRKLKAEEDRKRQREEEEAAHAAQITRLREEAVRQREADRQAAEALRVAEMKRDEQRREAEERREEARRQHERQLEESRRAYQAAAEERFVLQQRESQQTLERLLTAVLSRVAVIPPTVAPPPPPTAAAKCLGR